MAGFEPHLTPAERAVGANPEVRSNPARARVLHTPQQSLARARPPQEPRLSCTTRALTPQSAFAGAEGNLHLQAPHWRLRTVGVPQASRSTRKRCARNRCACAGRVPTGPFAHTDTRVQTISCANRVQHPQLSRLAGRRSRYNWRHGDPKIPPGAEFDALSRGRLRFMWFGRHFDRGCTFDFSAHVLVSEDTGASGHAAP